MKKLYGTPEMTVMIYLEKNIIATSTENYQNTDKMVDDRSWYKDPWEEIL